MINPDKQLRDLQAGFKHIYALNEQLKSQYNSSLKKINDKKLHNYEEALALWQATDLSRQKDCGNSILVWRKKRNIAVGTGLASLLAPFAISFCLLFFQSFIPLPPELYCLMSSGSGMLCIFGSFLSIIIWLVFTAQKPKLTESDPRPVKPKPHYANAPFIWYIHIKDKGGPPETGGLMGELTLQRVLSQNLSDNFLALHGILLDPSLDADSIVIGPTGIWVLESKYWQGSIRFNGKEWIHHRVSRTGGIPDYVEKPIGFPPHAQVQKEIRKVNGILSGRTWLDHKTTEIINGGIVFTHPNAYLQIDASCPVNWGTPDWWVTKILAGPDIPNWSLETTFEIADVLLDYHHRSSPGIERRSAMDAAERAFAIEKNGLETIIAQG